MKRRLRRAIKAAGDATAGALVVGVLNLLRRADPDRVSNFCGALLRKVGPWIPEHKVGRTQLVNAFPEKSAAEIDDILLGVWENLGRVSAEFAQLDRLWNFDPANPDSGRLVITPDSIERFLKLANDGKPALIFASHLANWELPAVCAATYDIDSAALYRRPNIAAIDKWVRESRSANMGELIATGLDAPMKIARALKRGAHVGMLVDQYFVRGVDVTFFGQRTRANPLLARMAQHFDCPIHGVRIIRLPGNKFSAELTEEIQPARDAQGKVDVQATTQLITTVIEGWIRQHPEQWLWLHRRWRPEDMKPADTP